MLYTKNNLGHRPLGRDDVMRVIYDACHYVVPGPLGQSQWLPTADIEMIGVQLARAKLEGEFVASVERSHGQVFEISKDLISISIRPSNSLGDLFYQILRIPKVPVPSKMELGTGPTLFREFESQLHIDQVRFSGNPSNFIGADVREGEIINAFAHRLFQAKKRKAFRDRQAARKNGITTDVARTRRYIERIAANHATLFCYRIDFWSQSGTKEVGLSQAHRHLQAFLEALATEDKLGLPVGYVWVRDFLTEIGYRHHLVLFFDEQRTENCSGLEDSLYARWDSITKSKDGHFRHSLSNECRQWGSGPLFDLQALVDSLSLMLMRNHYLRLIPGTSIKHFGMGEMPAPVAPKEVVI